MNAVSRGDLWGDLDIKNFQPNPMVILKEQASLLDKKTNNLVRGEIFSIPVRKESNQVGERDFKMYNIPNANYSTKPDKMITIFNIVVPALKNYRFELLRTEANVVETFPIYIKSFWQNKFDEISDLNEFETALAEILSSKNTKELIFNLILRSQSYSINE